MHEISNTTTVYINRPELSQSLMFISNLIKDTIVKMPTAVMPKFFKKFLIVFVFKIVYNSVSCSSNHQHGHSPVYGG